MANLEKMNLNYLLNKAYYDDLSYPHFGKCNKAIAKRRFCADSLGEELPFSKHGQCFALKTVYPGLLIGVGNTHEAGTGVAGDEKQGAEIKLGFTLDFVTGLPVIPGSTVKGVLRSVFNNYPHYIENLPGMEQAVVKELEINIFAKGGGKVVFFDAVPIEAGKEGRLLGLESITPHLAKNPDYNGLVNPNPITLLKVISGVVFLFRFGFDHWADERVSPAQLLGAFKTILTELGVGAKTNVGFGVMEPVDREPPFHILKSMPVPQNCTAAQPPHSQAPAQPQHIRTAPRQQRMQAAPQPPRAQTAAGERPVCRNIGCDNPVAQRRDGTLLPFCSECIQKHNERKAGKA